MKKIVASIMITIAISLIYNNVGAETPVLANGYERADIPLIEDGYNYYIRPSVYNDGSFIVMLPLSGVLYEYADISWDEGRGKVTVVCGTLDVMMEIGNTSYVINGERAELDAAPEIIDGHVYVPSSFFIRTFGFWTTDSGEGIIDLFMPSYIIDNI